MDFLLPLRSSNHIIRGNPRFCLITLVISAADVAVSRRGIGVGQARLAGFQDFPLHDDDSAVLSADNILYKTTNTNNPNNLDLTIKK